MSKKAMYLLGILLTILIGTYFYWKLCCNDCCDNAVSKTGAEKEMLDGEENTTNTDTKTPTSNAFAVNDENGDFIFKTTDNFNFNTDGFAILSPVSSEIDDGVGKLKTYLDDHTNKTFDIKGHYTSQETNHSAFPNLGLARANAVKNYMVSKGISSGQINTMSVLNDDLVPDGTIYKGPLMYAFTTRTDETAREEKANLEIVKTRLNDDPLILYFNTGAANITLTAKQRQKIADLSRYLDKVPSSKLSIVGHTDNTGNRQSNVQLGLERADFAKQYFVNNGIPESKIATDSKGPDQPIAANDTEEGRSKNRRTVVSLN